ncbi:MAG: glycosyltransferase family 4 protein [Candidatus Sumerlaeota bacterium]
MSQPRPSLPPRAYVMSQFPEFCETFVLNELIELERRGVPFQVFSLKPCRDADYQPGAKKIMEEQTHYPLSLVSPALWWAHCLVLFAHPIRYFSTLLLALHSARGGLMVLLKTLYVFLLAPWFARKAGRLGLAHIHGHWASIPSSGALFIARLAGLSFSLTAHAYDIFIDRTLLREKMHTADYLVTCTRYNRRFILEQYPDVPPKKVHAIYHGVNLDVFDGTGRSEKDEPILLTVGRLCDTKGYPDMIEACRLLKERGVDFQWRIVGDGPMRGEIEKRIADAGLGDHATILGLLPRQQVIEEYRRARLCVLACVITDRGDRDGLPNVVTEAMAMRVPVVSTSVSALPEAVVDGENGRLVEAHRPDQLADAIAELWNDPELRRNMGNAGHERIAQDFGLRENVEELAECTHAAWNNRAES